MRTSKKKIFHLEARRNVEVLLCFPQSLFLTSWTCNDVKDLFMESVSKRRKEFGNSIFLSICKANLRESPLIGSKSWNEYVWIWTGFFNSALSGNVFASPAREQQLFE